MGSMAIMRKIHKILQEAFVGTSQAKDSGIMSQWLTINERRISLISMELFGETVACVILSGNSLSLVAIWAISQDFSQFEKERFCNLLLLLGLRLS